MEKQETTRSVCLFGSSVDPPTKAHVAILKYLSEEGDYDEVWLLPVYRHVYSSKSDQARFEQRVEMCNLAIEGIPGVKISEYEKTLYQHVNANKPTEEQKKPGTADLLLFLTKQYPNTKFHFAMGADSFQSFCEGKWSLDGMINNMAQLEIVQRDETPTLDEMREWKYGKDAHFHKIYEIPKNTSSTRARNTKKLTALRQMVPANVAKYVKDHKLYAFSKSGRQAKSLKRSGTAKKISAPGKRLFGNVFVPVKSEV